MKKSEKNIHRKGRWNKKVKKKYILIKETERERVVCVKRKENGKKNRKREREGNVKNTEKKKGREKNIHEEKKEKG